MRLYHYPRTRATRVLWLLEEVGEPYDVTVLEWDDRESPEHLARHPLGRVPVVEVDDGAYVFESAAICLHIADAHPDADLIPPVGTHDRARAYQWTFFAMTELETALLVADSFREVDEKKQAEAVRRFRKAAWVVDNELDGKDYLVRNTFGVADVVVGGVLAYARRLELLDRMDRILAYLDRLEERPARQRALEVGAPATAS